MIKTFTSPSNIFKNHRLALILILAAGVFLRIFHYLNNRSLWEDEVFLASSLIRMDFMELATSPLDYQQRAPIGFLWLAHLGVFLFDKKELSLRLFPFITGLASLFTFVPVARYFLHTNRGVFAAVFIAALAPPLVYHAVEVKQYGTEFLCSILSLYLYTRFDQKKNFRDLLIWGFSGAVILWFSFSSLFVLFGMAGAIGLTCLVKKDWKNLILYMIPFSIWLLSFAIQYVFFISKFPEEEWLVQFWRNREAFMPLPPHSVGDFFWPFKQIYSLVRYPIGLTWYDLDYKHDYSMGVRALARMPVLPVLSGLLGLWTLFRRDRRILLLFAFPVILALVASAFEFYPLRERLTVFLAPIFILVIARGVEKVYDLPVSLNIKNLLCGALLAAPLVNSTFQVIHPELFGDYKKSSQREAMQYLQKNYREGDVVYVYWNNQPSFKYYQDAYGFNFKTIYGSDVRLASHDFDTYFNNLSPDFNKIAGNERLWYAYKPYNGIKIGDIENEPRWYYHKVDAVKKMREKIASLGILTTSFPSSEMSTDIKLLLFKLEPKSQF